MSDIKPCPFCGHVGVTIEVGSTFRWRVAECKNCQARCGEVHLQFSRDGTPREWELKTVNDVVNEWNKRV